MAIPRCAQNSMQQRWRALVRKWTFPFGVVWNEYFSKRLGRKARARLNFEPLEEREMPSFGLGLANYSAADPIQGATTSVGRVNVGLLDGNAQLSIPIDIYQSNTGGPAYLTYNSDTVDVRPVMQVALSSGSGDPVPTSITADLTFNGVDSGPIQFSSAGHNPGDTYLLAVQDPTAITASGNYSWSMTVTVTTNGGSTPLTISGTMPVVVGDNSNSLGNGWSLSGMDSLVVGSNGALMVYGGSGGARYFASNGNGTYTSPANEFGSLAATSNGFAYTAYDQTKEYFDSNGNLLQTVDPHGLALVFQRDSNGRLSAIDAPDGAVTNFAYAANGFLQTVTEVGSRTLSFAHSASGDLTSVTNADGGVRSFSYASDHKLTQETWGMQTTSLAYGTTGELSSINWGGSVWSFAPEVSQGLQTAPAQSFSADVATVVDPLGNTTTYSLDALDRTTRVIAADGGVSSFVLNAAGLVTQATDPLNNVTQYTYGNNNADATQIQYPDGGVVTMTYDPVLHNITSRTDQLSHTETWTYNSTGDMLTHTDALGNGTSFVWSNGLMTSETNALNHATSYQYNAQRQMTSQTDAANNTSTYGYNGAGWLTQKNIPFTQGNQSFGTTSYSYSPAGYMTSAVDSLGQHDTASYDALGEMTSETDALGRVTNFTYDGRGNLITEVVAVGTADQRTLSWTYNSADEMTGSTDGRGNVTHYQYDSMGQQTGVEDALGIWSYTSYDLAGQVILQTDALGNHTSYQFDSMGRLVKVTDALGYATQTGYDQAGNVVSETNARGVVTKFGYDADYRKVSETDDYGGATQRTESWTYDALGNVTAETDGRGSTTTWSYDAINRVSSETDGLGHTTHYSYYSNPSTGQVVNTADPLGYVTVKTYNGAGEVISVSGNGATAETLSYDAVGNKTSDTVGGNTTSYSYNNLNEIITETNALGGLTKYSYDADGNLTSLSDPDNNTTTFAFNADNQESSETDTLGHITSFFFNADGLMTSETDANGRIDTWTYDADGQMLTESWYESGGNFLETMNFSYDSLGNLLTAQNPNGTDTFTYDDLSRPATATEPFNLTLTYGYDAADNRTSVTDSIGGAESLSYDAANRLSAVSFTAAGVGLSFAYTYDARSEITQLNRYSNATGTNLIGSTGWGYNGQGDITSIAVRNAYYQQLWGANYAYDSSNRMTSKTVAGVTTNYSYDNTNQLTSDGTINYSYDANGNRSMSGYTVGAGNEITSDGTWNYFYDNEGNRIKKVSIATGETWTYGYDNANELVRANYYSSDGGTLLAWISYKYDALGNQIERDASSGQTVIRYVYDGGNVWADLDGNNNLATRRLYGPGVNDRVARISANGTVAWYLTDYENSIVGLLSITGTALGFIAYDAFGNTLSNTTNGNSDRFGFQGDAFDSGTGLYQFGLRPYDPRTGSWLSRDPGSFAMGDPNLMRFVGNAPTNYVDPTGMDGQAPGAQRPPDGMVVGAIKIGQQIGRVGQNIREQGFWDGLKAPADDSLNYNAQPHIEQKYESYQKMLEANWRWSIDFFPGWADRLTGGATAWYRRASGYDDVVDKNSTAYQAGQLVGEIHGQAMAALGAFQMAGELAQAPEALSCFPAGTLVSTEGGRKPIERLSSEDRVWAFDFSKHEWRLCDVQAAFERQFDGPIVTLTIGEEEIATTGCHPVWVVHGEDLASRPVPEHAPKYEFGSNMEGCWVLAQDLRVGDDVLLKTGERLRVDKLDVEQRQLPVYNIGVAELRNYAVGCSELLVHNGNGQWASEGIYEFTTPEGNTYVGQSGNIPRRIQQHIGTGRLLPEDIGTVRTTEVLGGRTAREIAEQIRILELGGVENNPSLANIRNPIGPARGYLLPEWAQSLLGYL
jgi:RHS repeat-associated protein